MKLYFEESQKFDSIWFYVILAVVSVVNYLVYAYSGEPDLTHFYVTFGAALMTGVIFFVFRLDTRMDENGIRYKFFPIINKWRNISWDEINTAEVREYKPIREYGGWGIRYGFSGKAYTTKGKTGLQLTLKNGNKNILIGTQKATEMEYILKKILSNRSKHA
ncbi:MAG: hypothetical protein IPM42_18055 [Saprospiraceae bacterium]|nr:hypothetical protein [Saprospiraceae bacterium]